MQVGRPIRNRKTVKSSNDTGTANNHKKRTDDGGNKISKGVIVVELVTMFSVMVFAVLISGDEQWQTYSYKLPMPPKLEGRLQPNAELKKGVRLVEGKLMGPESMELRNGVLYTGTADGRIIAVTDEHKINTVATFHQRTSSLECGNYTTEHLCGRPLGMRFDKRGFLYVVEAYSGLYKLNVSSGNMVHLVNCDDKSFGQPMKFVNDLDVTSEGVIYFSDTSANIERRDFAYLTLRADKSGRIFKFDPRTNETVVVLDNIGWANGVQLSPDEDFLLYSEGQFARIMKLHLKGPRKGETDVFYDNLPGFPDNIRLSHNKTFWVAIGALREQKFLSYDFITNRPWLRTIILKVIDPIFLIKSLVSDNALLIELDVDGNIIRSIHNQDVGVLDSCSEVLDTGAALYIGSFKNNFIGKLEL